MKIEIIQYILIFLIYIYLYIYNIINYYYDSNIYFIRYKQLGNRNDNIIINSNHT